MKTAVVNKPYYDEEGFDTYICDDKKRLYAIFDGMGTSEGARQAAKGLKKAFEEAELTDAPSIAKVIETCVTKMRLERLSGGSTAVVVYIDDNGQIHWASVGDSRLYIRRGAGQVYEVTKDEGEGNLLHNYVGYGNTGVHQLGTISRDSWTKFMICSDGITGDWPDQFIDDAVIYILNGNELPIILCQRYIVESKKPDDKTVIVGVKDE